MDNETPQSAPRRLHRRSSGRFIAGVAGGLGDYTGVDAVFFRIGFIVLSLAGGTGVLVYALGWLLIPEDTQPQAVGVTLMERLRGRRWVAAVLVGIAAVFFIDWIQVGDQNWTLLSAIALVGIGFVLLRDEPTTPTTATESARELGTATSTLEAPVPRVKKPRSPLGFMTLGAAFVAIAVGAALNASRVVTLDIGQFLALALVVVGVGLVISAWWGRARLLVVAALFLVPPMIVASMIDVPLRGSITSDYHELRREVADEYNVLAGTMTLDFSRYRFTDTETEVDISFGAGDVEVYVPPGVFVEVRGEVDLGVADLFGESFEGRNLRFGDTYERRGLTKGVLILNVDGGLGSFDTTWASWVEREKRWQIREQERIERKEDRKGARRDGRRGDRN